MKKRILMATAASMLFASTANATLSRIIALGADEIDQEGSYYIQDNRNIFLNVANVNDVADSVVLEWGGTGSAATGDSLSNISTTNDTSPKAQGGFFRKSGKFTYGIYLGNESNTSSLLKILASSPAAAIYGITANSNASSPYLLDGTDNQIDLFLGSEMANGIKWGTNFLWSKTKDEANQNEEESAIAVRFGLKAKNWDLHVNSSLKGHSKETVDRPSGFAAGDSTITHEFDGKLGLHIGGSYHYGDKTLFGYAKSFKWDQNDSYDYEDATNRAILDGFDTANSSTAGANAYNNQGKKGTSEGEFLTLQFGWAQAKKVNNTDTLFTKIYLDKKAIEVTTQGKAEVNITKVPVVLGYEAKATEWLTLRGSVMHELIGKQDNKNYQYLSSAAQTLATNNFGAQGKKTRENETEVRAGATLNFGKLKVDGFIGGFTSVNGSKTGILQLDNLLTRVGMTYNF